MNFLNNMKAAATNFAIRTLDSLITFLENTIENNDASASTSTTILSSVSKPKPSINVVLKKKKKVSFVAEFEALEVPTSINPLQLSRLYVFMTIQNDDFVQLVDGVRGDGFCSIWSIIHGYMMRYPNSTNIFSNLPFVEQRDINTIFDVLNLLMDISKYLLDMLEQDADFLENINTTFGYNINLQKWEIDLLYTQLCDTVDMIHGDCVFKLLGLILDISICVFSVNDKQIFLFGNNEKPTIYIQTDGTHYSLLVTQNEVDEFNMTGDWWIKSWEDHPLNTGETCFYIPTLG